MRILYITANLPHGTDEAFLIPEIASLRRLGHEVLVVPRSPTGDVVHGTALLNYSQREHVWSWAVLRAAASAAATHARRFRQALEGLRESRTSWILLKNLAVVPKAAWLAALAEKWGADHIYCHWAGTTATMAMIASRLSGVPWSLTLHRWDIVEDNLLARKARSASLVRFISENGSVMARRLGVRDTDRLHVIHMGVDMPDTRPRRRLPGRIVLCPARLVEVKGHRFLLEAWSRVRADGLEAELWLVGDGPLQSQLERFACSLGVQRSVRFLGTIPHNRLLAMYEEFDIALVVVPSIDMGEGCHEGIPVALIEAMSYGIPVISTPTGGTPELIRGGTGLLVRQADAGELAAAMQSLLSDPAGAQRLGEFGRRHVAQEFDVRGIAAELIRAFEAARSGPAPLAALRATTP